MNFRDAVARNPFVWFLATLLLIVMYYSHERLMALGDVCWTTGRIPTEAWKLIPKDVEDALTKPCLEYHVFD